MSEYTTQVRFICETYAGELESAGYNDVEEVLTNSWQQVFDFNFPIYNESYRETLCKKILRHFYTREIGCETVGLWKLRLNTRMNEIMPYYNKLYTAWSAQFNPLHDTDLTREHTLERSNETEENTSSTTGTETEADTTNRNLYSDTPQGSLQNVENETYLTNASKDIGHSEGTTSAEFTQETTGSGSSTDELTEHITGKSSGGSISDMLEKYRQALINIDMMIIGELENLFMLIW